MSIPLTTIPRIKEITMAFLWHIIDCRYYMERTEIPAGMKRRKNSLKIPGAA